MRSSIVSAAAEAGESAGALLPGDSAVIVTAQPLSSSEDVAERPSLAAGKRDASSGLAGSETPPSRSVAEQKSDFFRQGLRKLWSAAGAQVMDPLVVGPTRAGDGDDMGDRDTERSYRYLVGYYWNPW